MPPPRPPPLPPPPPPPTAPPPAEPPPPHHWGGAVLAAKARAKAQKARIESCFFMDGSPGPALPGFLEGGGGRWDSIFFFPYGNGRKRRNKEKDPRNRASSPSCPPSFCPGTIRFSLGDKRGFRAGDSREWPGRRRLPKGGGGWREGSRSSGSSLFWCRPGIPGGRRRNRRGRRGNR